MSTEKVSSINISIKKQDKFQYSIKDSPEITLNDFKVALHPYYWMELRQNLQSVSFPSLFEWDVFLSFNKTRIKLEVWTFERLTKGIPSIYVNFDQIILM